MVATRPTLHWLAIGAILLSSVGCDQATKHIAQARLKGQPPRSYCGDVFRLEYAENPGAFLGLGLLCTALAYLIYFRILAVAGATNLACAT